MESQVPDPALYDNPEFEVVTAWRTDRLRRLTYTQLWFLIQEHKVKQVGLLFASINFNTSRAISICSCKVQQYSTLVGHHELSLHRDQGLHNTGELVVGANSSIQLKKGLAMQIKYSNDYKTVEVQTKETAPGGARTERVALPYDPDLYHHMAQHGTKVIVSHRRSFRNAHT